MDDLLLALLSGIAELLLEALFEIALESIVALIVRSVRNAVEVSKVVGPILAGAGYLILGLFSAPLAWLSIHIHYSTHPSFTERAFWPVPSSPAW